MAEVALGRPSLRTQPDYYITKQSLAKEGCDSCWGVGNRTPSSYILHNSVKIPQGKLKETHKDTVLRYNEFIVYNPYEYMLKYIVIADMWYD